MSTPPHHTLSAVFCWGFAFSVLFLSLPLHGLVRRTLNRYIGVIIPLFSRQAERLIIRGRSKLHVLSRLYDSRLGSSRGGGDTDTDASAESSAE